MRLRMLVLSALIITSALAPAAMGGGGWWSYIDLEGQHLGIGETLTVRSEVWFRTVQEAEEASKADYYAYLLRGVDTKALERAMSRADPKHWWSPPAEMTQVGPVELSQWDSSPSMSIAHLTIPDMPTGRYDLMLCDGGCRNPLADLVPLSVQVVDDPLAAQTARKLQDTNERLSLALARVRKDLRRTTGRVEAAQADSRQAVDLAVDGARALRKRLASIATDRSSSPWPANLAWFVGGLGVASVAVRGRRRASLTHTGTPVERTPGDERELAASRSGP